MFPKSNEYKVRFDTCCVECEDSVLYLKSSNWNKGYLENNLQCYTIPPRLYMTTTDSGWAKDKSTSTLAFNISQFFSLLNHCLLVLILKKVGLKPKVSSFFTNYLIMRKTSYLWNDLSSPSFTVYIGVGQGSTLSPILLALYLISLLYILEKHLINLKIPVSILSFVDDGLSIAQNKSLDISNSYPFCSYNILSKLLDSFGLIIEHAKTEVFHFNRLHGAFNPPLLDLSLIGGPTLHPKDTWKYLGFIFDHKLTFY